MIGGLAVTGPIVQLATSMATADVAQALITVGAVVSVALTLHAWYGVLHDRLRSRLMHRVMDR
ncbi:MAG: DUF7512 family protein [Halobacteriota archaeon]